MRLRDLCSCWIQRGSRSKRPGSLTRPSEPSGSRSHPQRSTRCSTVVARPQISPNARNCVRDHGSLHGRWRYPFTVGRDVHSICTDDRSLYAVSTGTDELLQLDLDGEGRVKTEQVVWKPDPQTERADLLHLNDVAVIDGRLLISGFGPRPGPNPWQDARGGFVRSTPDGRSFSALCTTLTRSATWAPVSSRSASHLAAA
jgi:hypothetical protein